MEEIRQVEGQLVRKLILMDDDISNAGMYVPSIFKVKYNLFGSKQELKRARKLKPGISKR